MKRPTALLVAAALLVIIGVSGLFVGLELLLGPGELSKGGAEPAAIAIPAGIAAYGSVLLVAGLGIIRPRRWAHRLALATIAVGLVELVWQSILLGFDPVTLFGISVWGIVLLLLLLPAVRSTVGTR